MRQMKEKYAGLQVNTIEAFSGMVDGKTSVDGNFLKRIYAYAKGMN